MSHIISRRTIAGVLAHTFAIVAGFILMILGLALGITMVMLPVGIVVGLLGFALLVGGMFVRFDWI